MFAENDESAGCFISLTSFTITVILTLIVLTWVGTSVNESAYKRVLQENGRITVESARVIILTEQPILTLAAVCGLPVAWIACFIMSQTLIWRALRKPVAIIESRR